MNEMPIDFSKLEIVEIYVYHDRPLLFSCQNELGHKYLAVLVEEESIRELWLYAPMSERRFEIVRSGGIDLKTALGRPENHLLYIVAVPYDGSPVNWMIVNETEINPDWLPVEGERLNLPTRTIKQAIERRALQAFRESVTLRLNFRKQTRNEAPLAGLGGIFTSFQETLNAMINEEALMNVVGFNAGSFEVEVEAEKAADLFKYSPASDALNELVDLVNSSEDTERLTARLRELGPVAADKFGGLMKVLSQEVTDAQIVWGSPRSGYGGSAGITAQQASEVWSNIQETDEPSERIYEIIGVLRGLDLDSKHFRIVDLEKDKGKVYTGYISKDSIEDHVIQNARIQNRYSATIKEVYVPPSARKEMKLSYTLLKLFPTE